MSSAVRTDVRAVLDGSYVPPDADSDEPDEPSLDLPVEGEFVVIEQYDSSTGYRYTRAADTADGLISLVQEGEHIPFIRRYSTSTGRIGSVTFFVLDSSFDFEAPDGRLVGERSPLAGYPGANVVRSGEGVRMAGEVVGESRFPDVSIFMVEAIEKVE